jgi:hypothetical protein
VDSDTVSSVLLDNALFAEMLLDAIWKHQKARRGWKINGIEVAANIVTARSDDGREFRITVERTK